MQLKLFPNLDHLPGCNCIQDSLDEGNPLWTPRHSKTTEKHVFGWICIKGSWHEESEEILSFWRKEEKCREAEAVNAGFPAKDGVRSYPNQPYEGWYSLTGKDPKYDYQVQKNFPCIFAFQKNIWKRTHALGEYISFLYRKHHGIEISYE